MYDDAIYHTEDDQGEGVRKPWMSFNLSKWKSQENQVMGHFLRYDYKLYLTLRRQGSVICLYLLHRCDVIRIFKLCIEERGVSRVLLCSLKMRMSHQVQYI